MNINLEETEKVETIYFSSFTSEFSESASEEDFIIKNPYKERMINTLKYFKEKYDLTLKVQYMFHHLINFYGDEKYINYNYFVKWICEYYSIISDKIKSNQNTLQYDLQWKTS